MNENMECAVITFMGMLLHNRHNKVIVHPKRKIISSFTNYHIIHSLIIIYFIPHKTQKKIF